MLNLFSEHPSDEQQWVWRVAAYRTTMLQMYDDLIEKLHCCGLKQPTVDQAGKTSTTLTTYNSKVQHTQNCSRTKTLDIEEKP